MNRIITLVLSICFLLAFKQSSATDVAGGEILYRNIGGLKYEITVIIYRDCRGGTLDSVSTKIMAGKSVERYLSLTRTSIKDITSHCKKVSNPCKSANTSNAGFGIEEHIFKDTVDFDYGSDTVFKKLCWITIGATLCCRPSIITTGAANKKLWLASEFDLCVQQNNSPFFSTKPLFYICCNQPVFYSNGTIKSIQNDSISYSFDEPYQDNWKPITYNSGFSYKLPISVYWPTGYDKSRGPRPDVNPPIGLFLDQEVDGLIFTPIDCKEVTVISIVVTVWRKNSKGVYNIIGKIRRDLLYNVKDCNNNNVPKISSGAYKYDMCEGDDICLYIQTEDKTFIPPPPASPPSPDSLTLTWDSGIPGATFTIIDTTKRLKTGKFCWSNTKNISSDLPYIFTVTVNDNFCDYSGLTSKSYYIYVKKRAKAKIAMKYLKKGMYEVKATPDSLFKGTPSYFWEVFDSIAKPSFNYYFSNTSSRYSNKFVDTLNFYSGGNYFIHLRINNPPLNCPNEYFDSIYIPSIKPFLFIYPTSPVEKTVCRNTSDSIYPIIKDAIYPVKYKWSTSPADTLPYIFPKIVKDTVFRVDVYDSDSFHRWTSWKYYVHKDPFVVAGKDIYACQGDSVTLTANSYNAYGTTFWKWYYKGTEISNKQENKVSQPGTYVVEIYDSNNCTKAYDSLVVSNMIVSVYAGNDLAKCPGDTFYFSASGLDTSNKKTGKYQWFYNSVSNSPLSNSNTVKYKSDNDGKLIVKLFQTSGKLTCSDHDTANFFYRKVPEVLLKDTSICQNQEKLNLMNLIQKPTYTKKGIIKWFISTELKKPTGKALKTEDLIYDADLSEINNYYMKCGKSLINLGIKFSDVINLKFSYIDTFGCKSPISDSVKITIKSNFEIEFINSEIKRCYGDSVNKVSDAIGVNLNGGKWVTNNDSSNYKAWHQGNNYILSEKIKTDSLSKSGGNYLLKYMIDYNNCIVEKNAKLIIYPIPKIAWSQTTLEDSLILEDNSSNSNKRFWFVNSKLKSEEKQIKISKTEAKEKKIMLKAFNELCETDSTIIPLITWKILNTYKQKEFEIYPNPAEKALFIKSLNNKNFSFIIFNELSQKIIQEEHINHIAEIDISKISKGIYSILIICDEKMYSFRFLKK